MWREQSWTVVIWGLCEKDCCLLGKPFDYMSVLFPIFWVAWQTRSLKLYFGEQILFSELILQILLYQEQVVVSMSFVSRLFFPKEETDSWAKIKWKSWYWLVCNLVTSFASTLTASKNKKKPYELKLLWLFYIYVSVLKSKYLSSPWECCGGDDNGMLIFKTANI